MASAPVSSSSRAVFSVTPTPPAEFSPFTITKSGWWASRIPGSSAASVRRPMPPTTSPTNRSFTVGDSANLPAVETMTVTLAAEGLVKRFGDRVALRGVSLAARPGELVAIIGPNGAGKTTLLSILAGIQRADEGSITVAPAGIGWVPQQPAVYHKLTVEENLALIVRLTGEGTTVIYATHNIQEADRYADQLIVLADGELLLDGAPQELEREVGTTGLDFEEAFVEFLRRRGH